MLGTLVASGLGLASSVPAGAFGGSITPGHLETTGSFGFASLFDPTMDFSVQLETGLVTFRPRHPSGPLVTQPGNLVNITIGTQGIFANGCWLIPASEVITNPDLSATVTFNSSDPQVQECPGDPVGTTVLGALPSLGANGLVQGFVGPVLFSVTWTPATPITAARATTKTTCGPFASISEGSQQGVLSTNTGTVSATIEGYSSFLGQFVDIPIIGPLPAGNGDMNVFANHVNINGPSNGFCGQFGTP